MSLEEENKLLKEELEASRWNADDLCAQRNNLRAFVERVHGTAVMLEVINADANLHLDTAIPVPA